MRAKKKEAGKIRLTIEIEPELKNRFKAKASLDGLKMNEKLEELIKKYLRE